MKNKFIYVFTETDIYKHVTSSPNFVTTSFRKLLNFIANELEKSNIEIAKSCEGTTMKELRKECSRYPSVSYKVAILSHYLDYCYIDYWNEANF